MSIRRHIAPDGVVVRQKHLNAESLYHRFQATRRTRDITEGRGGRVYGLAITINSDYFVSVSAGFGYTPRGDYVELTTDTADFSSGLDYTDGVVNYIVLPYAETKSDSEAHETRGESFPTLSTLSGQIMALTATEYDNLADSYAADLNLALATDLEKANPYTGTLYKDSLLVIGRVIGAGFTAGVPNAVVPATNVQQEAYVTPLVTCSFANSPDTVEGINIKSVALAAGTIALLPDPGVPGGTPSAELTWDPTPGTEELTFTAPGDSVGSAATYSATGGVQEISVASNNGDEIVVELIPELLPSAAGSSLINFSLLYDEWGPIFTVADAAHRAKVGSYIPTDSLPHGEGFADLAQIVGVIPQPVSVGSGLIDTDARALYPKISSWARNGTSSYSLHYAMLTPGSTTGKTRFYTLSDAGFFAMTVNAEWDGTNWNKDVAGEQASKLALNGDGNVLLYGRDSDTAWTDSEWTDASTVIRGPAIGVNFGAPSTATKVSLETSEDELYGSVVNIQRSLTRQRILMTQRPADSAENTISIYHTTLSDTNAGPIEIVGNAYYDTGASEWTKHNVAASAFKFEIGRGSILVAYRLAASGGSWADSAWDSTPFELDLVNGHLDITGTLTAENATINDYLEVNGAGIYSSAGDIATGGGANIIADGIVSAGEHVSANDYVDVATDAPSPIAAGTRMYADQIVKCHGRVLIPDPFVGSFTAQYLVGCSIAAASISLDGGGAETVLQVTMDVAASSTHSYSPVCSLQRGATLWTHNDIAPANVSSSTFVIGCVVESPAGHASFADLDGGGGSYINFHVFGT